MNKIIIISGPTAVGKSDLAVKLALQFNGEVVSSDSMQIYKGMDVGTGKITDQETMGVPHHMIDFIEPQERYSAGRYLKDVLPIIEGILKRNKLPIIVGGTGLYINALINGMNFSDTASSDIVREKWKKLTEEHGIDFTYEKLQEIDPKSAEKISRNDLKRIIRALEIYEVTGKPKSEIASSNVCKFDYRFIILHDERETLYRKINARVDKMFELGLFAEASKFIHLSDCQSMQAIGYKQIIQYINGQFPSLDATKEEIKKLSRNYAKRQLTFLRGMKATNKAWYTPNDITIITQEVDKYLNGENND